MSEQTHTSVFLEDDTLLRVTSTPLSDQTLSVTFHYGISQVDFFIPSGKLVLFRLALRDMAVAIEDHVRVQAGN